MCVQLYASEKMGLFFFYAQAILRCVVNACIVHLTKVITHQYYAAPPNCLFTLVYCVFRLLFYFGWQTGRRMLREAHAVWECHCVYDTAYGTLNFFTPAEWVGAFSHWFFLSPFFLPLHALSFLVQMNIVQRRESSELGRLRITQSALARRVISRSTKIILYDRKNIM